MAQCLNEQVIAAKTLPLQELCLGLGGNLVTGRGESEKCAPLARSVTQRCTQALIKEKLYPNVLFGESNSKCKTLFCVAATH